MSTSNITVPELQSSRLVSVPLEILLQITRHLKTPEYGNVRLTCKALEETLFSAFSREFFTKRQFMIWTFSLQTLIDISKSRLALTLSHIIIGLEEPLHQLHSPPQPPSQHGNELQEYIEQATLLNTSHEVDMLAEAFSNLPNLATVGIRDFNSYTRSRDLPDNAWTSYGVKTFFQRTGVRLQMPSRQAYGYHTTSWEAVYLSRVFVNLLRALGQSGARPGSFEVTLRHAGLLNGAFDLPPYIDTVIEPVLANLHTLFLDLSSMQAPEFGNLKVSRQYHRLKKFLSIAAHLQHLRINFNFVGFGDGRVCQPLLWLSQPAAAGSPLADHISANFGNLRTIELGQVGTRPEVLLDIIRKFSSSLKAFSFHRVCLLHSDAAKADSDVNLWSELFRQMSKLNLTLSEMKLSHLSQQQAGEHFSKGYASLPVSFKDARQPSVRVWAGNDTQSGLRDLESSVEVAKPPEISPDNDDVEDSEGVDDTGDEDVDDESDDGDED